MDIKAEESFGSGVQLEAKQQVNGKKKDGNFTWEEDIFLCKAWLNTSCDSVRGKDQSSTTFWDRIGEEYVRLIGNNYVPRLGQSLPQRWSKIRHAVSKFCDIFKNIHEQNPVGYAEHDKINMAVLTYKNECKEKFKFLHCWSELRHSPKWNLEGINRVRLRNGVTYSQQSSTLEHFSHEDEDSPMPTPTTLEQPKGQKLVKQRAKKRKGININIDSSEIVGLIKQSHELMRGMHAEKINAIKQQQARFDEMLEIERGKKDCKIMLIDPTTLPDGRRQYFEKLQQKIFKRVCGIPPST